MIDGKYVISVIIPSFNHRDYVEEAVYSVLLQRHTDFILDVIVIDDGSTDGSVDVLRKLEEKEAGKFRLVLKGNQGLCKTLNRAINEFSIGDYIAVIASDDIWHEEKLARQLSHLRATPSSQLCFSNARTFGETKPGRLASKFLYSGNVRNILTLYNFVPAGTILFSRELYDAAGGFDENGLRLEDWDFLQRASVLTDFCYVNEALLYYRIHGASSMVRMRADRSLFGEKVKVWRKNRRLLNPALRFVGMCAHFGLDLVVRPVLLYLRARKNVG
jgi:alpha-1,3-rhamnosyltransferase